MNFPGIGDFGAIPLVYERHTQREGIRLRNRHELIHVQGKSLALLSSSSLNYLARRKEWAQLGSIAERVEKGSAVKSTWFSLRENLPDVGSQHRLPDCADTGLTYRHAHTDT